MNFSYTIKIIEVKSLDFAGKDIVVIANLEDFKHLCKGFDIIYKLNKCYYLIADTVAWVYQE